MSDVWNTILGQTGFAFRASYIFVNILGIVVGSS